jgi:hypothetical protein
MVYIVQGWQGKYVRLGCAVEYTGWGVMGVRLSQPEMRFGLIAQSAVAELTTRQRRSRNRRFLYYSETV